MADCALLVGESRAEVIALAQMNGVHIDANEIKEFGSLVTFARADFEIDSAVNVSRRGFCVIGCK